ncbi:DNA primase [Candidatus Termititenax persephonae]|uniref:DNA primase n=1 Tax=Candidatus Termititenax persephonae TaxID=2218525 RepID=A0A388TEJ3_9BACT|nr:DNA primase [Candidatus Termititenax persephonae]
MIDPRIKDEIKLKADIVAVIGRYVPLKKRGHNYLGLCPFHKEKTPSFTVSPDKGIFHCFGCGKNGDVFSFIREMEHVDFGQAVRILGEQCGVEIAEIKNAHYEQHKLLYQINEEAAEYFRQQLERSDRAQLYLQERKLSPETVKAFGLGFAPGSWTGLLDFLQGKYPPEKIAEAGLAVRRDGGGYLDRFHKRLMFPIANPQGKVVAFSGRIVEPEETAKYVNSPETPIFTKGYNLYGLHLAKKAIATQDKTILVEGQMDVIACHSAGLGNAVASLGTAFTASQARLLARYSKNVVIAYDQDEAGLNAADKAIEVLAGLGFQARVLDIPVKDPDEMIQKHGVEGLRRAVAEAGDFVQYKLLRILGKYDLRDRLQKAQSVRECLQMLAGLGDRVLENEYVQWLSRKVSVAPEILHESRKSSINTGFGEKGIVPPKYVPAPPPSKYVRAEEGLVAAMIGSVGLRQRFFASFQPEDLAEEWRETVKYLQQSEFTDDKLVDYLEERPELAAVKAKISACLVKQGLAGGEECFKLLVQRKVEACRESLSGALAAAEAAGDEQKAAELMQELQQLR